MVSSDDEHRQYEEVDYGEGDDQAEALEEEGAMEYKQGSEEQAAGEGDGGDDEEERSLDSDGAGTRSVSPAPSLKYDGSKEEWELTDIPAEWQPFPMIRVGLLGRGSRDLVCLPLELDPAQAGRGRSLTAAAPCHQSVGFSASSATQQQPHRSALLSLCTGMGHSQRNHGAGRGGYHRCRGL